MNIFGSFLVQAHLSRSLGILDVADSQSGGRLAQLLDLTSKIQTSPQDKILGSATWTGQSAEPGREDETWMHGTRDGCKWRKDIHNNPKLAERLKLKEVKAMCPEAFVVHNLEYRKSQYNMENEDELQLIMKLTLMVECYIHMRVCRDVRWQLSCGRHHFSLLFKG
jgi:hypothetical protein